jgi:hypothetical protein
MFTRSKTRGGDRDRQERASIRRRAIVLKILLPLLVLFSLWQLYLAYRYGALFAARRYGPVAFISYTSDAPEFWFSVAFYMVLPACAVMYLLLCVRRRFGLDPNVNREKKVVDSKVAEELTRTRIGFEDESIVEPYEKPSH